MRSVAPPGTWKRSYVPAHGGSQQLTHWSFPVSRQQSAEMRMRLGDQSIWLPSWKLQHCCLICWLHCFYFVCWVTETSSDLQKVLPQVFLAHHGNVLSPVRNTVNLLFCYFCLGDKKGIQSWTYKSTAATVLKHSLLGIGLTRRNLREIRHLNKNWVCIRWDVCVFNMLLSCILYSTQTDRQTNVCLLFRAWRVNASLWRWS